MFLFLNTDDFWRDYHALSSKGVVFRRSPVEEAYGTVAVFGDLYLLNHREANSRSLDPSFFCRVATYKLLEDCLLFLGANSHSLISY